MRDIEAPGLNGNLTFLARAAHAERPSFFFFSEVDLSGAPLLPSTFVLGLSGGLEPETLSSSAYASL